MTIDNSHIIALFPLETKIDHGGHLIIGGCDCAELANTYGTPLYVFDEATIRAKCREFNREFTKYYLDTMVAYASKAFLNLAFADIIREEGLGLDVVSGGEMAIARSIDFPSSHVHFHGNNKSVDELTCAIDWGIGCIVVDNMYELELVDRLAGAKSRIQDIWLRLNPSIDPHTHRHTTTGILDSKFGFPIATGQAQVALERAVSCSNINLTGLHFHLGSPIHDSTPYEMAIDLVIRFAADMREQYGFILKELSPGGGFDVRYTVASPEVLLADYAQAISAKVIAACDAHNLAHPRLIVEPGRAIAGQAGVALYRVGSIKDIPGVRRYVCVDGGMGDNIRPVLYDAQYEAMAVTKGDVERTDKVTIAGRYCESGDLLVKDIAMAPVSEGDVIAIPVSGAYCIPMASNYNLVPRPAIALVNNGHARIIRKRESYEDLSRLDSI